MTDPKTAKIQPVTDQTDPTDVFNDLEALRRETPSPIKRHELLTVVPVDKPPTDGYFRTNPDPAMQLVTTLYRPKDDKDKTAFFVTRSMRDHPLLIDRIKWVKLVVTYAWPRRQIGLWPLPNDLTGRTNAWWTSALAAYEQSLSRWVQMQSSLTHYTVHVAEGDLPEPDWPVDVTLNDLLKVAFKDRIISHEDVDIMKRLRGIE